MSTPEELATRLHDLESRLTWQDDTIDRLNTVISQQWEVVDRLAQRLDALEERVRELEVEEGGPPVTPPPHY